MNCQKIVKNAHLIFFWAQIDVCSTNSSKQKHLIHALINCSSNLLNSIILDEAIAAIIWISMIDVIQWRNTNDDSCFCNKKAPKLGKNSCFPWKYDANLLQQDYLSKLVYCHTNYLRKKNERKMKNKTQNNKTKPFFMLLPINLAQQTGADSFPRYICSINCQIDDHTDAKSRSQKCWKTSLPFIGASDAVQPSDGWLLFTLSPPAATGAVQRAVPGAVPGTNHHSLSSLESCRRALSFT